MLALRPLFVASIGQKQGPLGETDAALVNQPRHHPQRDREMALMRPVGLTDPSFQGMVEGGEHINGNPLGMSEIYPLRLPSPLSFLQVCKRLVTHRLSLFS